MNQKIKDLEKQIAREQHKIQICDHVWKDSFYNPETIQIPYGSKNIGAGSDPYFVPEGYSDSEKPRWTRECSKCGTLQHSYNKKPVITDYEPDFG